MCMRNQFKQLIVNHEGLQQNTTFFSFSVSNKCLKWRIRNLLAFTVICSLFHSEITQWEISVVNASFQNKQGNSKVGNSVAIACQRS